MDRFGIPLVIALSIVSLLNVVLCYDDDKLLDEFIGYSQEENDFRNTHVYPNLPKEFDAREAWPNCETIKIVPNRGSCTSDQLVTIASVISDRVSLNFFVFHNFQIFL